MAKGRGERREFWRQHVRAWRQSGQRREAYCREHDLNPQTFNVWVGRLRDEFRPTGRGRMMRMAPKRRRSCRSR